MRTIEQLLEEAPQDDIIADQFLNGRKGQYVSEGVYQIFTDDTEENSVFLKRTDELRVSSEYCWLSEAIVKELWNAYQRLKEEGIYHPCTEFYVGKRPKVMPDQEFYAIIAVMPYLIMDKRSILSQQAREKIKVAITIKKSTNRNNLPYFCGDRDFLRPQNWGVCPRLNETFFHDLHIH